MISSLSVVEYPCGKVTEEVKEIWEKVEDRL
jgi:hypothetical protein